MTLGHLLAVASLTVLAGRVLRFSWPAAALAGCSFALSGYVLGSIFWPPWLEPFAWLPLGIAAVERVIRDGNRRWLPVLSIAVAMPGLSGGYQGAVYIWYTYLIYSVIVGGAVSWSQRSLRRTVILELWLGAAALAGLALAAPQLLPTLELARQGTRAGGLQLNQILPFGLAATPASLLHAALVPPAQFFMGSYVGAVPLTLACVAFCGRRRTIAAFSVVLVACGVLGMLTPLWFLRAQALLPALGYFRNPSRVVVLASFGVALLAGAGLDALRPREGAAWTRYLPAILLASSSALLAAVRFPHPSWVLPALAVPVSIAAVGRAAAFRLLLPPVIGALLLCDLVGFSRNHLILPYVNDSWRQIRTHSRVLHEIAALAERDRVLPLLGELLRAPFDWISKDAMLEGFYSPVDYEPLATKRYGDFLEYASAGRTWPSERSIFFSGELAEKGLMSAAFRGRRFLNALSVRFLIIPSQRALTDPTLPTFVSGMQPVRLLGPNPDAKNFVVLEDSKALPRAYGVYRAECHASFDDQLARLAAPDFDPAQVVLLDGGCRNEDNAQGLSPAISIESYDAARVQLTADMESPGFIVLTDAYYPGWEAFVNGVHVPILRANTVVRAVRVPAGRSEIEFRYVPWSFYLGVGAATTIIAIGLIGALRRHLYQEPQGPPRL
jgi:hypothetical protein